MAVLQRMQDSINLNHVSMCLSMSMSALPRRQRWSACQRTRLSRWPKDEKKKAVPLLHWWQSQPATGAGVKALSSPAGLSFCLEPDGSGMVCPQVSIAVKASAYLSHAMFESFLLYTLPRISEGSAAQWSPSCPWKKHRSGRLCTASLPKSDAIDMDALA